MTERVVLNWFEDNEGLIDGLREMFASDDVALSQDSFITIRLGNKYADALNPDDLVDISISNDPENPDIIGLARVRSVKKGTIFELKAAEESLEKNIGAKNWDQVLKDMQSVYGYDEVNVLATVSIIELYPEKSV